MATRYAYCVVDEECAGRTAAFAVRKLLSVSDRSVRHAKSIEGAITVDGIVSRTDTRVTLGQRVGFCIDDATFSHHETALEAQEGPLDIVYEDEDIVILNKPADSVVHPSPGHNDHTLANYLLHHLSQRGISCNPHPVQRLDGGTSGLVVFATNGYVHKRLDDAMHSEDFSREYIALCTGRFDKKQGTVDAPTIRLTRAPSTYGVNPNGKRAVTHYKVEDEFGLPNGEVVSLVRLSLETGRTHQIRIHMAHIGHPLVGDATYGVPSALIGRHALHSCSLELTQPITGERVCIAIPLPPDMAALVPEN